MSGGRHIPWEVVECREVFRAPPWINVSRQKIRFPNGRLVEDYHKIDLIDFSLVVATADDGRILMERQYKQGIGKASLLLPGGGILEGEEPLIAARRELLEETGYVADDWQTVGKFVANANYGCGTAHIFTAQRARPVAPPKSGDLEEIELLLLQPEEIWQAIRSGGVLALSTIAAFLLAQTSASNVSAVSTDSP